MDADLNVDDLTDEPNRLHKRWRADEPDQIVEGQMPPPFQFRSQDRVSFRTVQGPILRAAEC
jgi:hypothetical protein